MNNKSAVYLTGGGAKGSFHIGFFKALEELGIKTEAIYGSSIGALVGGAATYLDSYDMFECWKTLTLESVLQVDSTKVKDLFGKKKTLKLYQETIISCAKPKILIDIENIRKLLYHSLDGDKIRLSKVDFGITTTVLPSFEMLKLYKKDMSVNILEYILASLYLPIFRPQKIIDQRNYLDISGFRRQPFEMLKNSGCSHYYIVNVSGGTKEKLYKNIHQANFDEGVQLIIINMDYRSSLLDFSEEQAVVNVQKGYETTMKTLDKTLIKNSSGRMGK